MGSYSPFAGRMSWELLLNHKQLIRNYSKCPAGMAYFLLFYAGSENICKKCSATPHGRAQVITIGPFLLLTHEATHARWSRPLYQSSSGGPTARTVGFGAAVARRA